MSAAELVAYCGRNNDTAPWQEFIRRFHRRILLYTLRNRRALGLKGDETEEVPRLVEKVYLRLLADDRSALCQFRGKGEFSLLIYLNYIVHMVVSESIRHCSIDREEKGIQGSR